MSPFQGLKRDPTWGTPGGLTPTARRISPLRGCRTGGSDEIVDGLQIPKNLRCEPGQMVCPRSDDTLSTTSSSRIDMLKPLENTVLQRCTTPRLCSLACPRTTKRLNRRMLNVECRLAK